MSTVSRSPSSPTRPGVRIPRYLRRYTICATAQHRPTSPLANSFVPDEQGYFLHSQEEQFWPPRRRSESFTVKPSPKVLEYTYSSTPQCDTPHVRIAAQDDNISISSTDSTTSFYTAVDGELETDELIPTDSGIDQGGPRAKSWPELSESSNSRSSGFGFASKGGQSSADTVVDAEAVGNIKAGSDDDDEWPVTYLTTITRQELVDHHHHRAQEKPKRRFTWGRKESRASDKSSETGSLHSRKSQKLKKKKRPSSVHVMPDIIPIYTQHQQDDFDPLLEIQDPDESQIGLAISTDSDVDVIMNIPLRSPQEILHGLDVVHEEEEDNCSDHLVRRESYPCISDKGKQRDDMQAGQWMEQEVQEVQEMQEIQEIQEIQEMREMREMQETQELQETQETVEPAKPRSRKLSKRRRSRRSLIAAPPPPPLPEARSSTENSSSETSTKTSIGFLTSCALLFGIILFNSNKNDSYDDNDTTADKDIKFDNHTNTNLGKRTTTKRKGRGKRRLSREFRTPNVLLAGKHFSEKHIPRFPSRLDGFRTADKKVVKYE